MQSKMIRGILISLVVILLILSCITVGKEMSKHNVVESAVLKEDDKDKPEQSVILLQRYPTQTLQLTDDGENQYYQAVKKYNLDEYVLSDPGIETIYPGAILRGDSLFQGVEKYVPVSAERTPMYLNSTGQGGKSIRVEDISYRTVNKALNDMQESKQKESPQEWTYYMQSFDTLAELGYSLGINLPKVVNANENFSVEAEFSMVAVVYKQIYYTVNAEPLDNIAAYFKEGTDISDFGIYEPAYVSSVDYGRTFVLFIYGTKVRSELEKEVSGCLKGVGIAQGIKGILQLTDVNHYMYQVGGKSDGVDSIMGKSEGKKGILEQWDEFWNGSEEEADIEQRINEYLDMGGDLINPIPLSYHLRYLSDNSPVPSVIVERKSKCIPKQDARLVKISLSGNLKGKLQLNMPEEAGFILSEDWTEISKKGESTDEIVILWDSTYVNPIEGTFEGEDLKIKLADFPQQGKTTQSIKSDNGVLGFGGKETFINISISDTIQEIQ